MLNFMKLELRKHRFLFRGIVGAALATTLLGAFIGLLNGLPPLQMMAITACIWAIPGLMLMPLLYGASSGAALRSEPAAGAEAGLPISPGRKVAGSLAAMGLYLLGVTVIFWTTAILLSPALEDGGTRAGYAKLLTDVNRESLGWLFAALGLFWLVMAVMLLASFTIAYQSRHSILGGLVGGLLSALMFAAVGGGIWLRTRLLSGRSGPIDWRNYLDAALIPLLGVLGMLAALRLLARWGERREKPGFVGWSVIELGTLFGAAAAVLWLGVQYRALSRSFEFVEPHYSWKELDPVVTDAASRYAFFETPDGALVSVDERGARALLLEGLHQHPLDLIKHLDEEFFVEVMWDSDGTLWVLTRGTPYKDDGYFELWHGTPDARLKSHSFFKIEPPLKFHGLYRGPDGAGLDADNGHEHLFAVMPLPGKLPSFAPLAKPAPPPAAAVSGPEPEWENPRFLKMIDNGRSLVRKVPGGAEMIWQLPEGTRIVKSYESVRSEEINAKRYFVLNVQLPDGGRAMAVFDLDGSVKIVWRRPVNYDLILSGAYPAWVELRCRDDQNCLLMVRTEAGEFLPPVKFDTAALTSDARRGYGLVTLWSAQSHVWLHFADGLYELDGINGNLVRKTKLPSGFMGRVESHSFRSTKEGYHFISGTRLYRIKYDGSVQSLGRARLE